MFQRGASARQHHPNRHGSGRPTTDGMPTLTKCNSGSTGSSASPLHPKKSPRGQLSHQQDQQHLNSGHGSKKNHPYSNDSSILKGAAILRRQISGRGTISSPTSSSSSSSSPRGKNVEQPERQDFDPWHNAASSSLLAQENRQEDLLAEGDARHGTRLNQEEDQARRSNDEDTVKLLERAKAVYQTMSFPGLGVQHQADHNKKAYVQSAGAGAGVQRPADHNKKAYVQSAGGSVQHQADHNKKAYVQRRNDKESPKSYIVQRVSDMDNSTFASSDGSASYLPTHLLSGSPSSASKNDTKRMSPHNDSPNRAQPIPSTGSSSFVQLLDSNEAIETSTVDFLANLHVKDDDISTVLYFDGSTSSPASNSHHVESRMDATDGQRSMISSLSSSRNGNFPHITKAAAPFQNMIAPCSYMYEELLRDPAYQHAIRAGALWQSLCSQHVRFPSLWWDGEEPGAPPLGTPVKNLWTYLGRHRVQGDRKLNSLIGNRGSSGRLLLHLVVRDIVTLEPIEDICCGCFHPNARGVRTSRVFDPRAEDCRDVWIGHRRRGRATSPTSTVESLLRHQNKGRVDASPLGGEAARTKKHGGIDNGNLNAVFGDKPPVCTVMILESDLYELFQNQLNGSTPASIVLLRRFLRHRIG